jgi:hypothetical protein
MLEEGERAPKPPDVEVHWKWPLTHSERIIELQELLTFEYWRPNHENIRAAIEYHRGFPGGELCSNEEVYFCDGKRSDTFWPPFWTEVKYSSCMSYIMLTELKIRAIANTR